MSSESALHIPALDDTLGAIEIGGICSTFLFGIGSLQTFHYFRQFPKDSRLLKLIVALLWFLELGHTISTWHALYSLTVTLYGKPQYIASPPHSLQMTILFSAPIYFIVQIFFADRIRKLSGRWPVTIICWMLTFTRAICTYGMLGVAMNIAQMSELEVKFQWLMATALSLGMTVDVIVASSMCYCLWQMRVDGIDHTRRMVDTLIVWTIETGLATGGTSVMLLIFFFLRKDLTWFPWYLILAKLFSNSMLASLNGRQRFRDNDRDVVNIDTGVKGSSIFPAGFRPRGHGSTFEMSAAAASNSNQDFNSNASKGLEASKQHTSIA